MKKLTLLTFLLVLTCTWIQAKTIVVSVGISDYPGQSNDLRLCTNDAKAIASIYKRSGAEVHTIYNDQATQRNIVQVLKQYLMQAKADDTVVFYFSGHGNDNGALVCYDGPMSYDVIYDVFAKCAASRKMVMADACFSGKMRQRVPVASVHTNKDVLFFLASRSNEVSLELPNFKNGIFTAYLERGLRGGADVNKDKVITAKEIFNFVYQGVVQYTAQVNHTQHPTMWGKFDDTMPVITW